MRKLDPNLAWLAAVLAATLLAPPLVAQDEQEDAPADEVSEVIVVTAQKREQELQEVPISVQAFTAEALQEANMRDLNEVITLVPGASEELSNNVGLRRYQIRGIGQALGDPTVGYYFDDAAFFVFGQNFAPMGRSFDLERIEVLRGPQSTLYGNGSMGGTVRLITRSPDYGGFGASLRGGYSSTDGGGNGNYIDAAVNIPMGSKAGLRLVASTEDTAGYQLLATTGDDQFGAGDVTNYRAIFDTTPNDRFNLRLMVAGNEADQEGGTLLSALDPPTTTSVAAGDYTLGEYELATGSFTISFGGASLTSTTTQIDATDEVQVGLPFPLSPSGFLDIFAQTSGDALNHETRLVSQNDSPFQWLVGVYYSETDALVLSSTEPPVFPDSTADRGSESLSLFAEVSYAFLDDRLVALAGLRSFEDERSVYSSGFSTQLEPATFDSVNPRFNLALDASEQANYYLNIAKGFRSGSFNSPDTCALHVLGGLPCSVAVDSDELWSYELGAKYTLSGGRLLIDVAPYFQDWRDTRQAVPVFGLFLDYQIGDSELYGVDLALDYRPASVSGLSFQFSTNWNQSELTNINPTFAAAAGARNGDRLPFVPAWTGTLSASYAWALGDTWAGQAFLGLSHIDDQLGQFGPGASADTRDLLRARFGFSNERFGIHLFGNNLLGEDGAIYANSGRGPTIYTQDHPRQIGVELSLDF